MYYSETLWPHKASTNPAVIYRAAPVIDMLHAAGRTRTRTDTRDTPTVTARHTAHAAHACVSAHIKMMTPSSIVVYRGNHNHNQHRRVTIIVSLVVASFTRVPHSCHCSCTLMHSRTHALMPSRQFLYTASGDGPLCSIQWTVRWSSPPVTNWPGRTSRKNWSVSTPVCGVRDERRVTGWVVMPKRRCQKGGS